MPDINACTTNFFPELCGINIIVDPQGSASIDDDRVIIIGQLADDATVGAGEFHPVLEATRTTAFGANSMLNRQIDDWLDIHENTDLYVYTVANNLDFSEFEVTFLGAAAATTSGTVYLWVNGQPYQVGFNSDSTDAEVRDRFIALLTAADNNLEVTPFGSTKMIVKTLSTGKVGGFLDIRSSYSVRTDLITDPRVTVTVVKTIVASGTPDLSGFEDLEFSAEFIINPFTDNSSVGFVSEYLCKQWSGGANSRSYGVFYGTSAEASALGINQNNAFVSYIAVNGALTSPYLETVAYGALLYKQLNCSSEDIAASTRGLIMPAMLAPEAADRFSNAEKSSLIEAGIGYFDVTRTNEVIIGRAVTTYTVSSSDTLDTSLRDVNKPAIIACISKFLRTELNAKFTGYSFRTDGVIPNGRNNVATLSGIRNFIVSLAQDLSNRNLVQNIQGFVESLTVNVTDEGCIAVTIDPELVSSFCCMNLTLRTL